MHLPAITAVQQVQPEIKSAQSSNCELKNKHFYDAIPVQRKQWLAIGVQTIAEQRKALKIKEFIASSTPPITVTGAFFLRERSKRRKQLIPRKVVEPDEILRLVNLKDRAAIPFTGKPANNISARVYRRKNKARKITLISISKTKTTDSEKTQAIDTCNGFDASNFFTDDMSVQFHTGIDTLKNLRSLFYFLNTQMDKWPEKYSSSVPFPQFEQFCLTLMSICHDLEPRDIASQFNLSKYDVTRCVDRFTSAMIQFLVPRRWEKCKDGEKSTSSLVSIFKGDCPLGKSVYIVDFVQVQVDQGFNYLKFFIAFSTCGLVCYAYTGYPGLIDEISMLRFSGIMAQLSHGDILICKSSNQMIDVLEFDQSSRKLKKSSLILEFDSLLSVRKIINVFKTRFAILRNMSVSSPFSTNYYNVYHKYHSSPSVDLSLQVCCAIHNSNLPEITIT